MGNKRVKKRREFDKDIFYSGEYIRHFNPDDERNPFYKIYKRKLENAIDIINSSENTSSILDVGGGMGRLSMVLSQSTRHDVVLVDVSYDMLVQAVKNADRVVGMKVVNADALQLPFSDGSFDIVVGLDLFCHLKNPETALHEFHRVLKNRGLLILDSTNSNPLWAFFYPRYLGKNPLNWFRIVKFRGVYPGWQTIVHHYSRKKFFSFLHKCGFITEKKISYGPMVCPKWYLTVSRKII